MVCTVMDLRAADGFMFMMRFSGHEIDSGIIGSDGVTLNDINELANLSSIQATTFFAEWTAMLP